MLLNLNGIILGHTNSDGKRYNLVFDTDVTLSGFYNKLERMEANDGFRVSVAGSPDQTILRDLINAGEWGSFNDQVVPAGTQVTLWSINPSNSLLSHYISHIRVNADIVPEPATYGLILGSILLGYIMIFRRRQI